jgi:hypothetical protein
MRKTNVLFLLAVLLVCLALPTAAQVTLSGAAGPAFSSSSTYYPNFSYQTATATGTGSAVINLGGVSTGVIRFTGTYSALTSAIQVSNDNTNYTTVPLLPVGGGAAITNAGGAASANNGLYYVALAGMTQLKWNVTAFTGTSAILTLKASATSILDTQINPPAGNPCLDRTNVLQSQSVIISTAVTVKIVDTSTTTKIYPCWFTGSFGASTTMQLIYGTNVSTDCDTTPTVLTGVYTPATGQIVQIPGLKPSPAGSQLCAVTTGTGGINGVLTYVQR